GMAKSDERGNGGDVPAGPVNGEAIANQQPQPGSEMAALPDPRHPFPFAGRSPPGGRFIDDGACHVGGLNHDPRPARLTSPEPGRKFILCAIFCTTYGPQEASRRPFSGLVAVVPISAVVPI